jgi:hypothetical protein
VQLFDMLADIREKNNLHDKNPEVVTRLTQLLEQYVRLGRSTPGSARENAVAVDIWKGGRTNLVPNPKKK